MSTGLDVIKPFERFPVVTCPGCATAMVLTEMHPVLLSGKLYTASYRCKECGTDTKRELKRELD